MSSLPTKNLVRLIVITLALLLIPLSLMTFDIRIIDPGNPVPEQLNWGLEDFIVMGILIFGTGLLFELLKKRVGSRTNQLILGVVLLGVFLFIWAELAVGLISGR